MYTRETLEGIHRVLRDKPVFVLCDDVYRALCYTEAYHSFAEYTDMRDRIIVVQSFSKPYAMTGWRLGYCMADAPVMSRIQVLHQYSVTSIPSFVQRACVTALGLPTDDVAALFRKRRDYVYRRLRDMSSGEVNAAAVLGHALTDPWEAGAYLARWRDDASARELGVV